MDYVFNENNEFLDEGALSFLDKKDNSKKKKKEEEDTSDDGLLDYGLNGKQNKKHKESAEYTDYKNAQIMAGKQVKTEKGWKKDQRRKKIIGAIAAGGVIIGGAKYVNHKKKMATDPLYAQKYMDKKTNSAYYRTQTKQAVKYARQNGQKQARREQALRQMEANQNFKEAKNNKKLDIKERKINDNHEQALRKNDLAVKQAQNAPDMPRTRIVKGRPLISTYKAIHNENYNPDELVNFIDNYNESISYSKVDHLMAADVGESDRFKKDKSKYYSITNREEKDRWEHYVDIEIKEGRTPMRYSEWKRLRKQKRRELRRKLVRGAAVGLAAAEVIGRATGHGGVVEMAKRAKDRANAGKYVRKAKHDANIKDTIRPTKYNNIGKTSFSESIEDYLDIPEQDLYSYFESLAYNDDFKKQSYERYCVMCEGYGIQPLDESAYERAKEHLDSYANAAIEGIRREKRKKEALLEKRNKEKEERRKRQAAEDREMMMDMTPEERREYLRQRRKDEDEENAGKKLWKDFKSSFVKGSGEELGHAAAKIATKLIVK